MKISYNWLCDYLPVKLSVEEISNILTAVGLEVEGIEEYSAVKGGLKNLVIGKVVECEKHPNADKLNLTKVDIGTGNTLSIVCGAPNVAQGQTVVVAPVGSFVHPTNGDSFEIKKAKIRGELSEGMICAEDEIGLGNSHEGIIVLNEEVKIGTLAKDYYKIPDADFVFEIGLTPNRMDAMSHMGCAKDICAYLSNQKNEIITPIIPIHDIKPSSDSNSIEIKILDEDKCKRYAGAELKKITIQDSPDWLKQRLQAIGVKTINNIVDITNYVLHETGQPLHAFDLEKIQGNKVEIKTVEEGTKFITLDNVERKLSSNDLMICNAKEAMCIAGVFGGSKSGISQTTNSVFLESANFENINIRKTSTRHDLRTDASTRFEKGADIDKVIFAAQRAIYLMTDIANAQLVGNITDIYPKPIIKKQIETSFSFINNLSGANYPKQKIEIILTALGFEFINSESDNFTVIVPNAKPDISIAADLVEEIMRIDGLDNIPFTGKLNYGISFGNDNKSKNYKNKISEWLSAQGFFELFTNSITNSAFYKDNSSLVKMKNNLSSELDSMRPSMLESGLQSIAWNLNRKNNNILFYEFGKTYKQENNSFIEDENLALYFSGSYLPENHFQKNSSIDFYFVKGKIQQLLSFYNINSSFIADENSLRICYNKNQTLFTIEKVNDERLKLFGIKQEVWFAVTNWQNLLKAISSQKRIFKEISKFLPMRRDLALVLDKTVEYANILKSVNKLQIPILKEINLFDSFESEKLGADKKSYAVSFSFLNHNKTLTDQEVDTEMQKIMSSLSKDVGAVVRS